MPDNGTYSPNPAHIILTRPAPSCQKTAEKIVQMGVSKQQIHQAPLTKIIPTKITSIGNDCQLPALAIIIITSQHALTAIKDHLDKALQHNKNVQWQFYVVGEQTSNSLIALLKKHLQDQDQPKVTHASNAKNLFTLISRAAPQIINDDIPVFYICGQDTHFPMAQSCTDIGINITQITSYRAQEVERPLAPLLPIIKNLPTRQGDDTYTIYVLLYSARTCRLFFDGLNALYNDHGAILQQKNLQFHFLSLSQDITEIAQKLYGESKTYPAYAQYSTAPSPDENALLEKLILIYDKKI